MKLTASWKRGFDAAKAAKAFANGVRIRENMGASLFSGSILISVGFNQYGKTHPDSNDGQITRSIHAEHACILKRQYKTDKSLTMYVYRETQDNKGNVSPAISKPCSRCVDILKLAGIKRVRYYNKLRQPEELKLC